MEYDAYPANLVRAKQKKMLHKNYQIIIHKIVHKDVCLVALFVKKKKEMT
jgi:hypothetical protein